MNCDAQFSLLLKRFALVTNERHTKGLQASGVSTYWKFPTSSPISPLDLEIEYAVTYMADSIAFVSVIIHPEIVDELFVHGQSELGKGDKTPAIAGIIELWHSVIFTENMC